MLKVYMTEHDVDRTMPAIKAQVVEDGMCSDTLIPTTRSLRLHADDDCLVSIDNGNPYSWTRLAADTTEWFDVPKDPRNVRVWVKAVDE